MLQLSNPYGGGVRGRQRNPRRRLRMWGGLGWHMRDDRRFRCGRMCGAGVGELSHTRAQGPDLALQVVVVALLLRCNCFGVLSRCRH